MQSKQRAMPAHTGSNTLKRDEQNKNNHSFATDTKGSLSIQRGRWVDSFDVENPQFWANTGRKVARRQLMFSIYAEFLGFAIWQIWGVVAPFMNKVGYSLSADQLFWLIAIPNLVGATLRFPYTFAVPRFGGRNWTIISSLLLLLPTLGVVYVVSHPQTPFGWVLAISALAGFGGANFASSMANISFFYPASEKGKALGMNAAGGNVGVAVAILVIPAIVTTSSGLALDRAGWIWIPFALLSALLASRFMLNLRSATSDATSYIKAFGQGKTWLLAAIYTASFGSFIGFSGIFPTLLSILFPSVNIGLAFVGPLVGSLTRPLGGVWADKWGGAKVTVIALFIMILSSLGAVYAIHQHDVVMFFVSFILIFIFTGVGNGSTYRMIPVVFGAGVDKHDQSALLISKRRAAGAIGVIAGLGAYGGFLLPRGFALSTQYTGSIVMALVLCAAIYALCIVLVWCCFMRPGNYYRSLDVTV